MGYTIKAAVLSNSYKLDSFVSLWHWNGYSRKIQNLITFVKSYYFCCLAFGGYADLDEEQRKIEIKLKLEW